MGKDYNTWSLIYKRIKDANDESSKKASKDTIREIANIIVNIWYELVINFEIIIYNYFAPMCCVIIQFFGYHDNISKEMATQKK